MTSVDRRLLLEHAGLAAAEEQGLRTAGGYRPLTPHRCAVPSADLRRKPDPRSMQDDQLLFGERFDVLAQEGEWALGRVARDGYVGWLRRAELSTWPDEWPTHTVCALRAFAFAEPDFKSAAYGPFALNALVTVEAEHGRYCKAAGAGWFVAEALAPIGRVQNDPAAVAEGFLRTPYRWGGRDGLGVDCSGLVQQSLFACGLACPRDADQQAAIGRPVAREDLRRGDLVFWPGHVGMMLDAERMIHANSFHMAVAIEPLEDAMSRIDDLGGGEPTGFRRVGLPPS